MCKRPPQLTSNRRTKLRQAHAAVSIPVIVAYALLSYRGTSHLVSLWESGQCRHDILLFDFLSMIVLYALEVFGAVVFHVTTLHKWTTRNFLEHHLPLVLATVALYSQNQPTGNRATLQHQEWMAFVLLISFNESSAALLGVWYNARLERFRTLPNICVCCGLLVCETRSWYRSTSTQFYSRDPTMWISTFVTQFLLAAALVHISYIKGLVRIFKRDFLAPKRPTSEEESVSAAAAATDQ